MLSFEAGHVGASGAVVEVDAKSHVTVAIGGPVQLTNVALEPGGRSIAQGALAAETTHQLRRGQRNGG